MLPPALGFEPMTLKQYNSELKCTHMVCPERDPSLNARMHSLYE